MHPIKKEGRRSLWAGACLFGALFVSLTAAGPASAQIDIGNRFTEVTGTWDRGAADTVAWVDLATWKLVTRIEGTSVVSDPQPQPWIPVAGDWDGDGVDTIQMFNSQTWKLVPAEEGPDPAERYEPEPEPWMPVAGDWDGRGIDTVRVVDLRDRSVHKLEEGPSLVERYDPEPDPWRPVAGDWDGHGVDTIAWVQPEGAFGAWRAVAGDWDGRGIDTVAALHVATGELVQAEGSVSARAAYPSSGCYTYSKNQVDIVKVFYGLDGSVTVIHIKMHEQWTCCAIDAGHTQYVCSMKLVAG